MSDNSPMIRRMPTMHKMVVALLTVALSGFGALNLGSIRAAENKPESVAGDAKNNSQPVGQLIVSGSATVNDKKAITGTTIFNHSRIGVACAKGSSAIVNLGRLGRVELSPGAKMVLRFSEGLISGDLLEGKAVVSSPAGVKVAINTPDGVSSSDGQDAAVTPVTTQRGVRCVPVALSTSSSSIGLSPSALAALFVGAGGAGAVAAVSTSQNTNPASGMIP